jgi:hypothetical protein
MSYDFTLIRKTLKEIAERRRLIKEAYRIPHNTQAHKDARQRLEVYSREECRDWATALHIAYAEKRGKIHCPEAALAARTWAAAGLLKDARALITERVAIPGAAVGSA